MRHAPSRRAWASPVLPKRRLTWAPGRLVRLLQGGPWTSPGALNHVDCDGGPACDVTLRQRPTTASVWGDPGSQVVAPLGPTAPRSFLLATCGGGPAAVSQWGRRQTPPTARTPPPPTCPALNSRPILHPRRLPRAAEPSTLMPPANATLAQFGRLWTGGHGQGCFHPHRRGLTCPLPHLHQCHHLLHHPDARRGHSCTVTAAPRGGHTPAPPALPTKQERRGWGPAAEAVLRREERQNTVPPTHTHPRESGAGAGEPAACPPTHARPR